MLRKKQDRDKSEDCIVGTFKKMKKRYKILIGVFIVLLSIICGFLLWLYIPHSPMEITKEFIQDNEAVSVVETDYYSFIPKVPLDSKVGVIIYPGARVDAISYARIGKELAQAGIYVYIVEPKLRLALLSINDSDQIIQENPQVESWYVSGHSLGGTAASMYMVEHSEDIEGIIFLASYPLDSYDFTDSEFRVLSIYASEDTFATVEDIERFDSIMPAVYEKVFIEGGNHEQFGYYGHQRGDGTATIKRDEQQAIIIEAIKTFLIY